MELDGIAEKIPSTEKILGVVWIVCWILAIWIYHLQFFLTGLFSLFLIFILIGRFDKKDVKKVPKPQAIFSMDKNTRTITVQKIYENNLNWEDHEICSGDAILPTGSVKEGDTITSCEGNLALRHIPTNTLSGGYNFEDE
jgi:hypothetical protein